MHFLGLVFGSERDQLCEIKSFRKNLAYTVQVLTSDLTSILRFSRTWQGQEVRISQVLAQLLYGFKPKGPNSQCLRRVNVVLPIIHK